MWKFGNLHFRGLNTQYPEASVCNLQMQKVLDFLDAKHRSCFVIVLVFLAIFHSQESVHLKASTHPPKIDCWAPRFDLTLCQSSKNGSLVLLGIYLCLYKNPCYPHRANLKRS